MSWVQLQMGLLQDKDRREAPGAAAELQRQQVGGGEEQIATQEAFEKSRRLHAGDHALNQPAEPHPGKAFMTNQESLRSHWSTLWEPVPPKGYRYAPRPVPGCPWRYHDTQ